MTDIYDKFCEAAKIVSSNTIPMRKRVYSAYFDHLCDIKMHDLPDEIQIIFDAFRNRLTSIQPPGDLGNDEASYLAKDILHMAKVVKAYYKL